MQFDLIVHVSNAAHRPLASRGLVSLLAVSGRLKYEAYRITISRLKIYIYNLNLDM